MKCSDCQREMRAHYTTTYCAWCGCDITQLKFFEGYIVYQDNGMHSPHLVFKNVVAARRWKIENISSGATVKKVFSPTPFKWSKGDGKHSRDCFADKHYYVVANHKFDPLQPFVLFASTKRKPATPMPDDTSLKEEKSEGDQLVDFFSTSLNR